jgi:hypothetical protein
MVRMDLTDEIPGLVQTLPGIPFYHMLFGKTELLGTF